MRVTGSTAVRQARRTRFPIARGALWVKQELGADRLTEDQTAALKADTATPTPPETGAHTPAAPGASCCHDDPASGPMHVALFYGSDAEYLDGVMAFLAPGLHAGEPVALALPPPRAELIRERLDAHRGALQVLDILELGRNPGRLLPSLLTMLETHAGQRLHHVGEPVWAGRSPEETQEALRHEALLNLAWPGSALRALCPYDARRLDASVLRDAELTHPWLVRNGQLSRNAGYDGNEFAAGTDDPLPDPPGDALALTFGLGDLGAVRSTVSAVAGRAGLGRDRRDDFVLAVNEVATNAIKFGPHEGSLRMWSTPELVICQLEDRGHIADRLAGRRRPVPGVDGGMGLWMVNQLCDLVQTRTTAAGTTIRLHTRRG
jgi:anti-sigma regulatory factor (Ser/Thr protein kinase)